MAKIQNRARARPSPYAKHAASAAAASRALNFKFNSDVGQHILKNPGIADEIVNKAHLAPTDTVLEVGPGTGNITVRLLKVARKVIACELDPRMAAEVTKRVQGTAEQKKLDVIIGDVIKLQELPPHDVLVSNTPYVISSPLVMKIIAMRKPPRSCVLMFQREFAQRLTAQPGNALYSRLSVNVQFFAKTTHVMKVGRNNFKPPPQVESDVVRIEPKTGSARPSVPFEEFDGVLRVCFNRKNKTLHAAWLGVKEVMVMCERNYRTYCAMNNIPLEDGLVDDGSKEDDAMETDNNAVPLAEPAAAGDDDADMDGEDQAADDDEAPSFFKDLAPAKEPAAKTPSKRPKTKVAALVREKVRRVLEDTTGLAHKRSRELAENDFLKLLLAFHKEGIHFS